MIPSQVLPQKNKECFFQSEMNLGKYLSCLQKDCQKDLNQEEYLGDW